MSITTNTERPAGEHRRSRRAGRLLAVGALVLGALVALPQLATAAQSPPEVPTELRPPAGSVLTNVGHAEGFQIYTCQPQGEAYAWALLQPVAVLTEGGHKAMALHYGGPSWTSMEDGSTIVATRLAGAPDPSGTSIPWLLLGAASNSGPEGGMFTSTTHIQRVNTTGGVAPSTGCDAGHVGTIARIPYTADYFFYQAG